MSSVSIVVVQTSLPSDEPSNHGCKLRINCGVASEQSEITAEDMQELGKINDCIRWYMEDFATKQPFQVPKAEEISRSLCRYAERLINMLRLPAVIPGRDALHHLVINIEENSVTSSPHSVGIFRWEILENMELWPVDNRPANVSVVRVLEQLQPKLAVVVIPPATPDATFNILALTARPKGVNDIPHRLITKDLLDVVAQANKGAGDTETDQKVKLDIVRPGSLEALKERLDLMERGGGRYDILHLDMHGIVQNDKAYAQFVKHSMGPHNVSAQDLAALLGSHGVQTVVLNACQSAVEGHGSAANLAKALIQHGVKTAVAMAYKVIDHTAKLFIRAFYEQLLCRKMSPFLAMRAARQCLVSNRTRRTRYQTKVAVDDYLVPSIYVHQDHAPIYLGAADPLTMKHNTLPFSLPAYEPGEDLDVSLVGRECDLLMLETALSLKSYVLGIQGPPGIGKSALSESAALWWKSTHLIDKFIKIDLGVLSPDSSLAKILNHELQLGLTVTGKSTGGEDANKVSKIARSLRPLKDQDIKAEDGHRSFALVTARQLARLPALEGDGDGLVHTLLPLDSSHALALSTSTLEKAGKLPQAKDWESLIVTEHFGNLAQGNPLAVKLSVGAYCSQGLSLHEHFQTLFRGSHMSFEKLPRELTNHRAFKDVKRHFESPNGFCTKARRLFFPFWTSFPFNTLADFLGRTYKTVSSEELKTAARNILQPFIDEGLATAGKSTMDSSEVELEDEDEYVTLHPLVVLGVRDKTTEDHFGTLEMSVANMPALFSARIKQWPLRELYWKKEWDRPRAACQREFYNFLGTTYMALIVGTNPAGFQELLHLMHMTVKGLCSDRSRRPLMAEFWKFALHWVGELEDEYQRLAAGWRKKFNLLVLVDISRIIFCMSLFDYYSQHEEGEAQKYKGLMMSIYNRRTRIVGLDPIEDAVGPQLEILASSKAAPDPSRNMSAGQLREKAAARRAYYHAIEAKGFDISGFDSAGFSSMDGGFLPKGNALLGQDKDVFETVLLAKRKMESRFPERPDIGGARKLLYKALEDDLFIGATPASQAAIHRTLSEVVEEGAARYYERKEWERQKTGEIPMGSLTGKYESEPDDTKEAFREGWEGHWRQALYHWEQALDIESDAGFDKSAEEVERERVRTDLLKSKAAGLFLFDFDSIASSEHGQSPQKKQRRRRQGRCVVL